MIVALTFIFPVVGIGYGIVAVIHGQIWLTNHKELVGIQARFAGMLTIAASVLSWWLLTQMWQFFGY